METEEIALALGVAAVVLSISYAYYKIRFYLGYFSSRGLPFLSYTESLKAGLSMILTKINLEEFLDIVYTRIGENKMGGHFNYFNFSPVVTVKDPDLIEKVLIKDFSCFTDHFNLENLEANPLASNLFNLTGQKWRTLRNKLSPIFTSGKIKWMYEQIIDCGDNLVEYFDKIATGEDVQIKETLSLYGLDVIGSCAFGLNTQALKNQDSEFLKMVRKIFQPTTRQIYKAMFISLFPKFAKFLRMKSVDQDVLDYFIGLTKDTIESRIKNNTKRNDFVQLLLQLKQQGYVEYEEAEGDGGISPESKEKFELTDDVLTSQLFIFFLAGFDTTSTTASYVLYFLSVDKERQNKLRDEIKKFTNDKTLTYEAVNNMTYLDNCVSEALRLMPPASLLMRNSVKDCELGGVKIEKNTPIFIPVHCLHYDERYFHDAKSFIPERFEYSKYSTRQSFGVYMPFGDGPRVCIARRFAILQVKIALIKILENFEVMESSKNVNPLKRYVFSATVQPKEGLHMRVKRLNCNK